MGENARKRSATLRNIAKHLGYWSKKTMQKCSDFVCLTLSLRLRLLVDRGSIFRNGAIKPKNSFLVAHSSCISNYLDRDYRGDVSF